MNFNPWQVEGIQAFSYLNCPECTFKTKEEPYFQHHAIQNHPLSFVLFDAEDVKVKVEEGVTNLETEQNKRPEKFESYIGVKLEEDDSLHYGLFSRNFVQLEVFHFLVFFYFCFIYVQTWKF